MRAPLTRSRDAAYRSPVGAESVPMGLWQVPPSQGRPTPRRVRSLRDFLWSGERISSSELAGSCGRSRQVLFARPPKASGKGSGGRLATDHKESRNAKIAFLLPRARRRACAMMARDMAAEWAIAQQRLGDEDRDMLAGHALNPHDIRLLIGTARIRLFARGRLFEPDPDGGSHLSRPSGSIRTIP